MPSAEPPNVPTRPLDHGCAATHAMVSAPSWASLRNGEKMPSLAPRPRTSCDATVYPALSSPVTTAGSSARP